MNGEKRLEDDVARLYKDMYYGNGLPGMTTRMANVEECMKDYKWMKRISITTLVAVVVDMITRHIHF